MIFVSFVAEKPGAKPLAPTLISGSLESVMRRIRIYEGRATEKDLELPV